jgi:phosphate transport system ATP-binding protein
LAFGLRLRASAKARGEGVPAAPSRGGDLHHCGGDQGMTQLPNMARFALRRPVHFRAHGPLPAEKDVKLEARHVCFRYGGRVALTDVSMPLYADRVTALLGPSGCGKTTLLRVFNRMYSLYAKQRAEGAVIVDGRDILAEDVDLNALRRKIGMVFQQPEPFAMSIYDNVAYGLRLYANPTRSELDGLVEQALRRAGLWKEVKDILRKSARALSGGQQQRLCIARSIAVEPEILLLDEPCSALDPESTARIENTIDELKTRCTIAIVTHNLQQAARVSDFTAFMHLGRLVEFGETEAVFTHPTDKRTGDYVAGLYG